MASYTALNSSARNSDANLAAEQPSSTPTPTPTPPGAGESNSLLEHLDAINFDAINFDEPLTPPNPNRFSSFSPSIGTNYGSGVDSVRDSVVSESNSAVPISGAAGAIAGAAAAAAAREAAAGANGGAGESTSFPASKEAVNEYDLSGERGNGYSLAGTRTGKSRRMWWIAAGVAALIVAAAVAIPVGLVVGRKDSQNRAAQNSGSDDGNNNGNGNSTDPSDANPPTVAVTTGGDGSTVTTEDGSTFTYSNKFGGFWVSDPHDPFNNGAQPNSWTPPLNASWRWGVDKIHGVNLGGLFVLEPFIVPALYQKYQTGGTIVAEDEWTLSQAMAADTSEGGGLSQLEEHYDTFITEEDIAQIAGAGLNWVRLPIPFWAVDAWGDEPFLARTCWKYILRVFRWCRKYGLRIKIDLHTAPGSQNGYNHSGKLGQIDFLRGVMGYANAQRMLGYVRIITEFIAQPEYQDLIPMFGIVNEPRASDIGQAVLSNVGCPSLSTLYAHLMTSVVTVLLRSYLQAYDMMRNITGIGEGNGPFLSLHDGFLGLTEWADFLPGADRVNLDVHPYFAFNGEANTDPIDEWVARPCTSWGSMVNNSQSTFGVTVAGEFSNAINDCGLYLNGVTNSHTYGGDCSDWEDASQWDDATKEGLRTFALASFDSLQNWLGEDIDTALQIGNSTAGRVEAPLWSYKAGLEGGWMPLDPRDAVGTCAQLNSSGPVFDGAFESWQTGGAGAGTIAASELASYTAWPPTSMRGVTGDMAFVPTYTPTGTVSTLPADTFTDAPTSVEVGDGWADASDTAGGVTEVAGCSYPDPWDSAVQTMPTTTCTGTAAAVRFARRTPPPVL
ncbi:glycoside hydrolase [Sanghuangporus baumii]|uniref:glucan 1,3-beta-glucosidase n=1 Tax=Sanghuangporus baumii TaxID=108892 RepID=A0A9Q5NB10_SANBA|nr:glycoside hydrolase [Sanghuangporus baumii]